MCGLAGAILQLVPRQSDELRAISGLFTEALLCNQVRGTDATGVAVIRRNGRYKLFKRPGIAAALVADEHYRRVLSLDGGVTVLLGHCRQKTLGTERNPLNNHPILAGTCLGIHNGWLSNAHYLTKVFGLPRVAEVDSEVLFRLVDHATDDYEFTRLLAHCRGRIAAAFVRLREPGRLCLLRGDMPLCAAYVPRLQCVLFASEPWMLRTSLSGQTYRMLDLAPFTLSTFDARNVRDFTQREVFFQTPDAGNCLPTLQGNAGVAPSVGRPPTAGRATDERRTRCPAR